MRYRSTEPCKLATQPVVVKPHPRVSRDVWRARQRCDTLLAAESERREQKILKHRRAYVNEPLIRELLGRVEGVIFTNPRQAREIAHLALFLAQEMAPGSPKNGSPRHCADVLALCHAQVGNTCRVLCRWEEADDAFHAAAVLLGLGTGSRQVRARVLSLRGSWLSQIARCEEAVVCLEETAAIYHELEDRHHEGITLLNLSAALGRAGWLEKSLPVHQEACLRVDERRAAVVAAAAWNNLARIYLDLGRFEEADSILETLPSFVESFPPHSSVQLNLIWTAARVADGLGKPEEALETLERAAQGFDALNDSFNAALVRLDTLKVLLRQGRLGQVERCAEAVLRALRREPLAREARQALQVLAQAASRRRLVEAVIEEAIHQVQTAVHSPASADPL